MKRWLNSLNLAGWALLFVVLGVLAGRHLSRAPRRLATPDLDYAIELQDAFAKVAESSLPAVVVVRTGKKIRYLNAPRSNGNNPYDDLLERFLRRGLKRDEHPSLPTGQGSGFIIDPAGYIVTGHHVIRGQNQFTVQLHDGREFDAKVVGVDPKTDLAVLKIHDDKPFPTLRFADAKTVKVGHWAIAIGAPFSLDYTVTAGIVSHMGRSVGMNVYENYIQTDASINPGNSGGPLLNLNGDVIGINDFILTSSPAARGNIGLSFAISSDLAKKVVAQLIKNGMVTRPWLGIVMMDLNERMKQRLIVDHGVLITGIGSNSPAAKADLRAGDVILKVDGRDVDDSRSVQLAILERKPGDEVSLTIDRQGDEKTLSITTGEMK